MNYIKSFLFLVCLCFFSFAQANVQLYIEQIKNNPHSLYKFFKSMPKGGELHYHLAGGIYPETMLSLASKSDYCLNKGTWIINKNSTVCDGVYAKDLLKQPGLYAKVVRSWSMKDFIPGKETGHDHFFNTFEKFYAVVADHQPELVAEVIKRAAQQHEDYLELMLLPDNGFSMNFGELLRNTSSFSQKRKLLLLNKEFQNNINHTVAEANRIMRQAHQKLRCTINPQKRPCQIKIKFLYYSLREQSLDNFFAQTLNGFEAIKRSQENNGVLVGVNLVQAEDGIISLRDYHQQMLAYQYLHQIYPSVNISLHAGEITKKIVTPNELGFHIHDALFTGQAQRIGHGVDIVHENKAHDTLAHMATQHKAVEINLTSNLKILNISAHEHPINYYLKHRVPVVLSTDDEGVLRTNLSMQYVQAVLEHGLDYQTLKQINRNALTYAFLSGKSIWLNADQAILVHDCRDLNSRTCKKFIKGNEKAQLQWKLEHQLSAFESKFTPKIPLT